MKHFFKLLTMQMCALCVMCYSPLIAQDLELDDLLEENQNTAKVHISSPDKIQSKDYFGIVAHRLKAIQWLEQAYVFQLGIGKGYGGEDLNIVGNSFSSSSYETFKYLARNSYGYPSSKNPDAYYWSECASGVDSVLRAIGKFYFSQEKVYDLKESGNQKVYERYIKYNGPKREKVAVNRAISRMKSTCKKELKTAGLLLIKDVHQFAKKKFSERKEKQAEYYAGLQLKKEQWKNLWNRKNQEAQNQTVKLIQELKEKYSPLFKATQLHRAATEKPVSGADDIKRIVEMVNAKKNKKNEKKCYFLVTNGGNYSDAALSDFSIPLISRYIRLVNPVPMYGIKDGECAYRLSVIETRENITVTIGAEDFNVSGVSDGKGLDGTKSAIVAAVINGNPDKRDALCRAYAPLPIRGCNGNAAEQNTYYAPSLLRSVLDQVNLYPNKTRIQTITKMKAFLPTRRSARDQDDFFEEDRLLYQPDRTKQIFYHKKNFMVSFQEKNDKLQSIHFPLSRRSHVAVSHAGFGSEMTVEEYVRRFREFKLINLKLESKYRETKWGYNYMYVSLSGQTDRLPSLHIVVKFKKQWSHLNASADHLKKSNTMPFTETALEPEEIIFY